MTTKANEKNKKKKPKEIESSNSPVSRDDTTG